MLHSEHDEGRADLVARVVEEYFERVRRGERPRLEEFVERYSEISDLLRTVIPGLLVAEQSPSASAVSTSALESIGDFNILREIGRGGMGIVYEAEQVSLGRRVALKVLLHHAAASSKQRLRFQREARAAARLHHTNIVPVFGVGNDGDNDYYVMQLIHGSSLEEVLVELRHLRNESDRAQCAEDSQGTSLIAQSLWQGRFGEMPSSSQDESVAAKDPEPNGETVEGASVAMCQPALKNRGKKISPGGPASSTADSTTSPLPLTDSHLSVNGVDSRSQASRHTQYCESVARIGLQVASALHYAHDHSVLHRDIKPSNLILDGSGTVWVGDFGLAKVMDQQGLTNTGDILGTLRYMPPEAFQGQTDLRSDLYSLGITLYEMLVLRPAYDEADRHLLISHITAGSLERLDRVDPSIPRDLVTIVHKAIERDPADRYQSASEMEADLASFLADEPIKARRISWIERGARWSRHNRGMTAAVMSIAALLILGTVASMFSAMHFARLRDEAEYNRYVSDMFATNYRTEEHSRSTILARNVLADTPTKFLNWEWAFLANKVLQRRTRDIKQIFHEKPSSSSAEFWARGVPQVHAEIVPRYGIGTGIMSGGYNTEGTALVLTLGDGSAELYSLANNGSDVKFRLTRDSTFFHMASSPDDTKLVGSVVSGPVVIYDRTTSEPITISPETCAVNQVTWVWSPNQAHVISLHPDGKIRIWDASTLDPDSVVDLRDPHPKSMWLETSDIRFTESGDELWSAAIDGTIRKWSFPQGELLDKIKAPVTRGMSHHGMSPNGKLAVATFDDGSSFLWEIKWDAETHDCWQLREADRPAANMRGTLAAFSRDGTCVAVMNGLLTATIYDVEQTVKRGTGARLCEIEGHSAELVSVQFSPNGEGLLTVSHDGTAKIWTCQPAPTQGRPTFANAHRDVVFQLAFDPHGNRLLSGSFDGTARVWDLATRRWIATFKEHHAPVVAVDFNVQGTRAASLDADGVLHVWDPVTGSPIFAIYPQSDLFAEHIRAASGRIVGDILFFPGVLSTGLFTPDGAHVVAFEKDAMKVFRADDGTFEVSLVDSTDHGWPVFNHDSTLVAILEMNARRYRVWDLRTGQLVTTDSLGGRHSKALSMVDFSPVDDKIVSGGMGGDVIVRNARTGDLIHPPLRSDFGVVYSCRFSGDGRFVLVGYNNGRCQVTDADSGEVVTTLAGHLGAIRDVRISPDGTRLLSWSVDDHAIVWDLARPSANQLVVLGGKSRLIQAHWSPDGRDIITAWSDGSIGVWEGATKQDLASLVIEPGEFEESVEAWRDSLATAKKRQRD